MYSDWLATSIRICTEFKWNYFIDVKRNIFHFEPLYITVFISYHPSFVSLLSCTNPSSILVIKQRSRTYTRCFKKEVYNCIRNVTVWRVLRKRLLKCVQIIRCSTPWKMDSLYALKCKHFRNTRRTVTVEYHCKALFETPCVISGRCIEL
jgi:hypothetical protein